jgi:hypothetical protein
MGQKIKQYIRQKFSPMVGVMEEVITKENPG